jgi:hypothetical protein
MPSPPTSSSGRPIGPADYEFLDELGEGVIAAASAGTDVLLTAFGPAPLGRLIAEGLGIPSVGVYLAPGLPTREFPPPGSAATGQVSPDGNLAAGRELLAWTGSLYPDVLARMRARLGLPAAPWRRRARPTTGRSATGSAPPWSPGPRTGRRRRR